jgi:asparagine synthetase B (glutamine-hydrolysing)
LIRCAAFCLCLDKGEAGVVAERAAHIDRARAGISVTELSGEVWGRRRDLCLTVLEAARGAGGGEGEVHAGLPAVHGFLGDVRGTGEYSLIDMVAGTGLEARRDTAGTRPLFVGESSGWVASDHRFFRDEVPHLLPPGARYEISAGRATLSQRRPGPTITGSFEDASAAVARAIDRSVRDRVHGTKKVAVAFSGGLDSSILVACAKRYTRVVACAVSAANSVDRLKVSKAAEILSVDLRSVEMDAKAAEDELSDVDLPFEPSLMDRSLWCIYSAAARTAAEEGVEVILLGQLADELFGGYQKYERALQGVGGLEEAEGIMLRDVAECGMRGFVRDEAACARWLEPRFPFADGSLMDLAQRIPMSHRLRGGVRKALLRSSAGLLGVPGELAGSPKKAAQYSSGILKLLK